MPNASQQRAEHRDARPAGRRRTAPGSGTPRRVCVYALVRGPLPRRIRVGGQPFDILHSGSLAAIVRAAPRPPVVSDSTMRDHDSVVRALASRFPAVLPVRFGACMTADELLMVLTSRRESLVRGLAHVRGRVQMTIRVIGAVVARTEPGKRAALNGSEYLRDRARRAADERRVPGFEPVRAQLARWVREEQVEHRGRVSTIYHLVPRAAADSYRRTAERALAAADLSAVVSGPWPPYAFAVLE